MYLELKSGRACSMRFLNLIVCADKAVSSDCGLKAGICPTPMYFSGLSEHSFETLPNEIICAALNSIANLS